MGLRPFLYPFLLIAFLLASCSQDNMTVGTAVPILPATATSTPQSTNTPTPKPTQKTAVITPTDTRNLVSTPTPTLTSTPETMGFSTLPAIPQLMSDASYQLRVPDSEIIVQVLTETLAQFNFFNEQSDSTKSDIIRSEFRSLFKHIANDITRYYPKGFSSAANIVTELHESNYESHDAIWAIWQAYVLQELNKNQTVLVDQTTIEISYASLTVWEIKRAPDNDPAWLLFVVPDSQSNYPLFWPGLLPIGRSSDSEYYLLPNNISGIYFPEYTTILRDYDFTGDGQKDIVVDIGLDAGEVLPRRLEVYRWDNSGVFLLANIDAYDGKYTTPPQVEIDDFNEDGRPDIQVFHQGWMDMGCRYEEIEIFSWDGTELQYTKTSDIGEKPECDAARAVTQNLSSQSNYIGDVILSPENLNFDERITLINRGLANLTIETAPSIDYIALLRLHLAMAYLGKGENELAHTTFSSINELPNTAFINFIQDVVLTAEGDLVDTCRLIYQEKYQELDMRSNYDLLATIGALRNYGYPSTALQRRLCPFPMVITGLLDRLVIPTSLPFETTFSVSNINIMYQYDFNIDDDPEVEWVVVVESAAPQVIILDKGSDTWKLYRLAELIPPVTDFQFQPVDTTLDGNPALLVQATQNIYSWNCWGDQQTDILTIGLSDNGYELLAHDYACVNDSLPLSSDKLANNFYESPSDFLFVQQINDSEEMILTEEQSLLDLQTKLNHIIENLPNNTPPRQMMLNRLLYLKGMIYELIGDADQAASTYKTLIQQAPNSSWSWLAWARLEAVEQ